MPSTLPSITTAPPPLPPPPLPWSKKSLRSGGLVERLRHSPSTSLCRALCAGASGSHSQPSNATSIHLLPPILLPSTSLDIYFINHRRDRFHRPRLLRPDDHLSPRHGPNTVVFGVSRQRGENSKLSSFSPAVAPPTLFALTTP